MKRSACPTEAPSGRSTGEKWGQDMWKRDQVVKPVNGQEAAPGQPVYQEPPRVPAAAQPEPRQIGRDVVNIGKSVVIKGELNGSEDLTIEGQVEGTINLKDNVLTIGPNGNIKAQIFARTVVVLGAVTGNVTASEKVDIRDGGSVEGDLVSPRVGISEGAHFRGSVDMKNKGTQAGTQRSASGPQTSVPHGGAPHQQSTPAPAAVAH
jgi:cytoskeletal protein CcmA (bactofilin family)